MRRSVAILIVAFVGAIVLLDRIPPPDVSRYQDVSVEVVAHDGTPLRTYLTRDGMLRLATSIEDVDPLYLDLLVQTEDQRFWKHPGVDPFALLRAVWQLTRHGHVVSGGSTITMQVARMLAPHRRDLLGKFADIARALQLERRFSKDEILGMYLTLAPMGGNVEGVRSAAQTYFRQNPRRLTSAQAALLVAIPRSPTRFRPDRFATAARSALSRVCALAKGRRVTCGEENPELPSITSGRLPMHAAHLADSLRFGSALHQIRTTLHSSLQSAIEDLTERESRFLKDHANIAVVVVANADRSVLAYVGGANYFGPLGMVDVARALRSPGSTLKPFIYGLAFDEGLLVPESIIEDRPVRFGEYAPKDFDGEFRGPVTATEALQQSYNSPAVQILSELGVGKFAARLRHVGVGLGFRRGAGDPGLSLALGGVGITLRDLAMLYSGLANDGRVASLRFLANSPVERTFPVMTALSAQEIRRILVGVGAPERIPTLRPRDIAYKTGTSYGFRDALAVGFSGDYTVAVWVGRTEGTPRPGAFGRNTAAPILFQIFDLLPLEPTSPAPAVSVPNERPIAPSLQAFQHSQGPFAVATGLSNPPRITFPPSGARLDLNHAGTTHTPLVLEAAGGAPPYRWIVNGEPLSLAPVGAAASWTPDGPGWVRITVVDGKNNTASAEAWVN
jgi:penicillin-binding protein 1C